MLHDWDPKSVGLRWYTSMATRSAERLLISCPRCFEEAAGNLHAADDLHLKALAHLSTGLMNATETAVKAGVTAVGDFTIIPLVVGGDDVTVVCTGATALSFTRSYIEELRTQHRRNRRSSPYLAPERWHPALLHSMCRCGCCETSLPLLCGLRACGRL
jgi:hypothetical protein